MPTKITIIYDNPVDHNEFEAQFAEKQIGLLEALPGLQGLASSRVWPKDDGSPTPAHRIVDAFFVDYETACIAVAGREGAALFAFASKIGTAGLKVLFSDIESVPTQN